MECYGVHKSFSAQNVCGSLDTQADIVASSSHFFQTVRLGKEIVNLTSPLSQEETNCETACSQLFS